MLKFGNSEACKHLNDLRKCSFDVDCDKVACVHSNVVLIEYFSNKHENSCITTGRFVWTENEVGLLLHVEKGE